jgi:hypothetical protein
VFLRASPYLCVNFWRILNFILVLVKIKHSFLVGATICSLFMTACQPGETPTPDASPSQVALTSKTWKMAGWTVKTVTSITGIPDETYTQDLMQDCLKDNTVKYNADKTLHGDTGATKCSATEAQTGTGTWELLENDKKIKIGAVNPQTNVFEENIYDVVTLNDQTFTYRLKKEQSFTDPFDPSTTFKVVVSTDVTLSAQ